VSVAYFIVPEREVEGVDVSVNGKALARSNGLTKLARRAKVRPLDEYYAMSPEEAADYIEESGGQVPADALPDQAWFEPAEGLATVRGLLAYIANHPGKTTDEAAIVRDLRDFETALLQLQGHGVRWHLGSDG
jgi:hypothetical protein